MMEARQVVDVGVASIALHTLWAEVEIGDIEERVAAWNSEGSPSLRSAYAEGRVFDLELPPDLP